MTTIADRNLDNAEALRASINHRLQEQGFTAAELAVRCEWSEVKLANLIDRIPKMSILDLDVIARALNTDMVGVLRDVEAFAAGVPVGREQQLVWKLPKWATTWYGVEIPNTQRSDQAWLYASRNSAHRNGSMEIRAELTFDAVSRQVEISFDRTPTFRAVGSDDVESSAYTLAEARSVAGWPDGDAQVRATFRELLDAYDAGR